MAPDTRRSVVLFVLAALLLAAIIETPGAARTDDVGRTAPPFGRSGRPGGFLPTPGQGVTPGFGTTVPVDASGPPCTKLGDDAAAAVVDAERAGTVGADTLGDPLLDGSVEVAAMPRGADGSRASSQPIDAAPIDGTPYVLTTGTTSATPATAPGTAPGPALGAPARRYAAIEVYDRAEARLQPVAVFDNCVVQVGPPGLGAGVGAHLWLQLRSLDGNQSQLAELDPVRGTVVWSAAHAPVGQLAGTGDHVVVTSRDHGSADILDASTHAVVATFDLRRRVLLRAPEGELWATSSDTLYRLAPDTGADIASFPLPDGTGVNGERIFLAGGSLWTVEPGALVQRDRDSFQERRRIAFASDQGGVSGGADDLWVATAGSVESDGQGEVIVDVDLRHLDARTGDERSSRHLHSSGSLASPTLTSFAPHFSVDRDGVWYEGVRTASGAVVEGSEGLFRYDGG